MRIDAELEGRLGNLGGSDHVCMIYENREEQLAAAVPYLLQGLAAGECCL